VVPLGFEVRLGLIVAAKLAVVDVPNFGSTLSALLSAGPHTHEHSHIKVSLKTQEGLDVLAVTAGCRADGVEQDPQSVLREGGGT
jgi:hypothetical protein